MAKIPISERKLNKEQKRAVEFGEGPLMIIAGAGTGKTTVVTERIKYLITSGKARPEELLALSFTEKSAREMEERVDQVLPYGMVNLWISTFHAFADRVLKAEAISIGLDPGYSLMSEVDAITFFRKHLFEFELNYFRPLGNPTKFIRGMLTHFSRLKDEDVDPTCYLSWVNSKVQNEENSPDEMTKYRELAGAYRKYEELKIKHGVADYSDLIGNTLQIFRKRGDLLKRYQDQFKYILIDEFQDTNFAQNQLGVLLSGERQNITVVGDDDQAIYRWRGAAISNMIQFRAQFGKLMVITLTQNYRSSKEILDRSYDLIQQNNPDRLEIAEKIDKKLESMRRVQGEPIEVIYADRVEDEAELVAQKIGDKKNQYEWRDFAILVRANNHAEPFARALSRAGIPYQFLGPGQLLRQPEVKDLIAYLKVLANYEDNVAMYRVLTMSWAELSGREIARLINQAKKTGVSLFEAGEAATSFWPANQRARPKFGVGSWASQDDADTRTKIERIVVLIHKHLERMKKETAGQILYHFLEETGLLKSLANYKTAQEEKRALNIAKFFDRLKTYEAEHEDASVFAVVDWLDLSLSLGESPAAANEDWSEVNAVNILTVHSAKGLEFPVVFVTNLVSARFPGTDRREQIPIPDELVKEILPIGDFHLEEERRLFYVAMTRARDYLYLTAAKYYGEGKREKKLSPFIGEAIGEDKLSDIDLHSRSQKEKQLSFLDWEKPEEVKEQKVNQEINFISYSQLESFATCPLQYKYRYLVKIPVPAGAALVFGDAIHRTLKQFYDLVKTSKKVKQATLLDIYKDIWATLVFSDRSQQRKMYENGLKLLQGFFEKAFDPKVIPLQLEESFKIKLTPRLTLGGKIDRIDALSSNKVEVIDYKTGQAPKARDAQKDLQLSIYALAAQQAGTHVRKATDVLVSFYFLEGAAKISSSRTQDQLDAAKTEVIERVSRIERSDFRPTPGKHCDFCEFRLICEAWQ